MTEVPMPCPHPETLAEFAEGKLERRRIPEVLAHVEHCETCMSAIELADEELSAEEPAQRRGARVWAIAAAAAVAAVALTALFIVRPWRSPIDRLVAAVPRGARVVEPRLSG